MIERKERDTIELQKRALYFFKEGKPIHVKLNSGYVYNGIILDLSEADFIILIDRKIGEMPLFFTEINILEAFREDGKWRG